MSNEFRVIEKCGYNLIVIPYYEYEILKNEESKKQYILNKLHKKIND
jgi:hypothetical protein